ncbi:hypothetical protein [Dietzia alimentaria]|uniref:hypothetical protein n=1 Tax=Dietzia alimentaria TaxID=665550 RepID=UPI001145CACB|nr:hypothetical protein [Dietzia alimentaria]
MVAKRYIPERTVDSLFAAEVVRYDPYALIWSPSQRDPNPVDHTVHGGGGNLAVFECKAVNAENPTAADGGDYWFAEIDRLQLDNYVAQSYPVLYLLLAKPIDVLRPWNRSCDVGSCGKRLCRCCARDARSWGALNPRASVAAEKTRFQPWYAHWAWVLTAKTLDTLLDDPASTKFEVRDNIMSSLSKGTQLEITRLCHFLDDPSSSAPSTGMPRFLVDTLDDFDFSDLFFPDVVDEDTTGPTFYRPSAGNGDD